MDLISVLLTTYNSEKTLQRLLDSIVRQKGLNTDFDIELLIVDDCSTDSTQDILRKNNLQFYVNDQNSGGPNLGRNQLLKLVKGDFITIADDDDEWHLHKIETFLSHVEKAPILTAGYQVKHTNTNEIFEVKSSNSQIQQFRKNETFQHLLAKQKGGQTTYLGSIFFSSTIEIPDFEMVYGRSDFEWILNLFHNQDSAEIPAILYTRYVDGQNLSLNETYRKQDLEMSLDAISKFEEEFPKLSKLGKQRSYGTLARYFYVMGNMKMARQYFLKADKNWKTALYYLTTYVGSSFVKKKFKVFG